VAEARHSDQSAGFLLIEVAIALTIVAIAFGYGFRSISATIDRLGRDYRTSEALMIAQSTLDRVGHDIALSQGDVEGKADDGFTWQVQSRPYTAGAAPTSSGLAGYVVVVTVGWKERITQRQVQLSTVRLVYGSPN